MILRHWLHFYLARVYLVLRNPQRAASQYQNALSEHPRFALAAACLGYLHANEKQYDDAVSAFERALAIEPGDADNWFNLGYVFQQQHEFERALASFRRAVELKPSLDRAWFGMGTIHATRREYEQAVPALRRAADLQPMNPHAWYALAKAHHALDHPKAVRRIIKHVSEFDPQLTNQLIRETGLLPEGVEPTKRLEAAGR